MFHIFKIVKTTSMPSNYEENSIQDLHIQTKSGSGHIEKTGIRIRNPFLQRLRKKHSGWELSLWFTSKLIWYNWELGNCPHMYSCILDLLWPVSLYKATTVRGHIFFGFFFSTFKKCFFFLVAGSQKQELFMRLPIVYVTNNMSIW